MNAQTLVSKISEELKKIVDTNEQGRNKDLRKAMSEMIAEEAGTVDSCFKLRQLLLLEDGLRKMKNNAVEWPKAVKVICGLVEKSFDKFYYDIDYELRDSYSFWIIINNRKGLCIELDSCGCREFEAEAGDPSCKFKWGIIDRQRVKYIDKFEADTFASVSDYLSLDRMIGTITRTCKANIK